MSLLDVFDRYRSGGSTGGSPSSTRRYVAPAPAGFGGTTSGPTGGGSAAPAQSSQERGVPERIDLNKFVTDDSEDQGVPLQLAELAGKAPGFIAERPIAAIDTILGKDSPLDQIGSFGPIKFAGEAIGNLENLPSAIANQSTIESLAKGTREGWSDDTRIQSTIDNLANNPLVQGLTGALPFGIGGSIEAINEQATGRKVSTWGEFKADAEKRGFSAQDVKDYMEGRKAATDFGDRAMSSDPLTNLGLKFGSDPLNLLFGVGAVGHIASGTGMLARAVRAGAMAEKVVPPTLAAQASRAGLAAESTWVGLARYFGDVGRGIGAVPGGAEAVDVASRGLSLAGKGLKAYQKAAIATTGAQVALKISENTPLSGFLEPLYQLNDAVWDNQPLSDNMAFSLFSAFHFDAFRMAGTAAGKARSTARIVLGDDVRSRVLSELSQGEGWGGKVSAKQVEERLGGREQLDNLITHTVAQRVFKSLLSNPQLKNELSHYRSLDEAIVANRQLGDMVREIVADDMAKGKVSGHDVVTQLRSWYGERSGVDASLDFPWDGRNAVDRWVEYAAASAPVSKIFKERGDVVVGLIDQPTSGDMRHMRSALGLKANEAGMVPVTEVRRWLSRYPQLAEDKWWERFLAEDQTGQFVEYKKLQGKLRAAEKKAPTARDLFREAGDVEEAAAKEDLNAGEDRRQQFVDGTGQVVVSRMRPTIARRLKMDPSSVTDIMAARGGPEIAQFEENIGQELAKVGLPVDSVSQSIGGWETAMEPSVQIAMPAATLPELRLAAALAGKAAKQDAAGFAVTHNRLRELLLDPNGYEAAFQLPTTNRSQLQLVAEAVGREFEGFTINDTTGRVSILAKGGDEAELAAKLQRVSDEISGYFDRDLLDASTVQSSVHPAYIEFISSKRSPYADATYADVLRDARKSGDPRAGADLGPALTYRKPAAGDAAAGLGPDQVVGRAPGHERVTDGNGALSPAERVGFGDASVAVDEPGYVYHQTTPDALEAIATEGLRPHSSEYRRGKLTWSDGGTGARVWYRDTAIGTPGQPLLRVRPANIGATRVDRIEGATYSRKTVSPQHIEVWGADGAWHPLDTFFTKLEPDIAEAAAQVAPVYRPTYDETYALERYLYYLEPNERLRSLAPGEEIPRSTLMPERPTASEAIDALIQRAPRLQKATTFYRTINDETLARIQESGGVFTDQGYLSTAKTRKLASIYNEHPIEVEVPAGTQVLDIDAITPEMTNSKLAEGTGEMLLPRGSTYDVIMTGDKVVLRMRNEGPRFDPTPDSLSAGLRAIEDAGPSPADTEADLLSELASLGDEFSPETAARGQELNLEIEKRRLAKGEAKRGQVTYMARLDKEASAQYPLHRSLSDLPAEQLADLEPFEAYLREHYPAYTLQKAPNAAIMAAGEGDIAARYLRDRTWLGNVLIEDSRLGRLMDALFAPVKNSETGKAAKQALMNELIPHGATPAEVDQFLAELNHQASIQTIAGLHLFRNGQSLPAQAINRVAAGDPHLGMKGIFKPETIQAIGANNFARVMDRASNRFIRMTDRNASAGPVRGRLARAAAATYDAYAKTPVGDVTRVVGKTLYPIFRFMADPRWHAMNLVEADMLMGARYGMGATRFTGGDINAMSRATAVHAGGQEALESHLAGDGTGFLYARRHIGHASRAFDAARPETTLDTLRAIGNDQVQQDLRELVRLDDVAHGRPERAPADVFDQDIVAMIDKQLYDFDTKGVQKTVIDTAQQELGSDELERLRPFLARVYQANQATFDGIVKTLGGNPNRSNLERVLNSYWLYWPLSYQIKATRWLVDTMTHRFGGAETNLAPAALYAHYVDEHRKMLAQDPDYVAMFKDHPTVWFLAQMLFPITPGDVGVSLSRGVRYAGGELGIWGKYKAAEDPFTAAGAMTTLGPSYTAELLARVGREFRPAKQFHP